MRGNSELIWHCCSFTQRMFSFLCLRWPWHLWHFVVETQNTKEINLNTSWKYLEKNGLFKSLFRLKHSQLTWRCFCPPLHPWLSATGNSSQNRTVCWFCWTTNKWFLRGEHHTLSTGARKMETPVRANTNKPVILCSLYRKHWLRDESQFHEAFLSISSSKDCVTLCDIASGSRKIEH